MRFKTRT